MTIKKLYCYNKQTQYTIMIIKYIATINKLNIQL